MQRGRIGSAALLVLVIAHGRLAQAEEQTPTRPTLGVDLALPPPQFPRLDLDRQADQLFRRGQGIRGGGNILVGMGVVSLVAVPVLLFADLLSNFSLPLPGSSSESHPPKSHALSITAAVVGGVGLFGIVLGCTLRERGATLMEEAQRLRHRSFAVAPIAMQEGSATSVGLGASGRF